MSVLDLHYVEPLANNAAESVEQMDHNCLGGRSSVLLLLEHS